MRIAKSECFVNDESLSFPEIEVGVFCERWIALLPWDHCWFASLVQV